MIKPIKLITAITVSESKVLVRGQLEYMSKFGLEPYLLYSPDDGDFSKSNDGVEFIHIPMEREISPFKDLISLFKIIKIFKYLKPDIVNAGTPKAGLLCITAATICRVPVRIYTLRGFRHESLTGWKLFVMKACEKFVGKLAHKIICISPSVKELGIKEGLIPEEKVVVLAKGSSNGLNLNRFDRKNISKAAIESKKKELGIRDEEIVLGFVGRIIPRKGVSELINAWKTIRNKYPNIKLLLVGQYESEQPIDTITLDEINNDERILTTGRVNDVELYMCIMNIFVFPAHWEGFGNVLIEAAALGLPIITTNATGVKDAVSSGYNAIVIEPKTVRPLIEALESFLNNPVLATEYGLNGLTWAKNFRNEFVWDALYNLYIEEFENRKYK